MTPKSFLLLAGITTISLVAVLATGIGGHGAAPTVGAGRPLFPDLAARSAEIASLTLRAADGAEIVVARDDGRFVDRDSGYPVDEAKLRELVRALVMAEIAEAKTADPARHADLTLAAPGAARGAGREVVLADASGAPLADVVIGARDYTLGGALGGQYMRRGGEDATWLARARIDPPARRADWFDRGLTDFGADRVARLVLSPAEGEAITLVRRDGALEIEGGLPAGRQANRSNIDRLARLIGGLSFADVRRATGAPAEGATIRAAVADGPTVVLTALPAESETDWIRISVEGDGEMADALRARVAGFDFALSSYDAAPLGWTADDLTEPESAS
ncbi:DUF4340 domain-containing protein [Ruixingdingia sedimenti]|uniref:DUF4340 domain-containing protein n=1 Tax=Ruixingdingia sedimenti TaxID=3073604 RepID=A0ABU1FBZ8_9RHOB|nr:DUF4340 domain-containing protein [Xinfangfangia sp. LG-4]MDR5654421.1 DUF4340 domain-containing protein [Xinfangfangia sp. LG-4]